VEIKLQDNITKETITPSNTCLSRIGTKLDSGDTDNETNTVYPNQIYANQNKRKDADKTNTNLAVRPWLLPLTW